MIYIVFLRIADIVPIIIIINKIVQAGPHTQHNLQNSQFSMRTIFGKGLHHFGGGISSQSCPPKSTTFFEVYIKCYVLSIFFPTNFPFSYLQYKSASTVPIYIGMDVL